MVAGQVVARLNATRPASRSSSSRPSASRGPSTCGAWTPNGPAPAPIPRPRPPRHPASRRRAGPRFWPRRWNSAARRNAHLARIDTLEREIAKLEKQILASNGKVQAAETQLALWSEENGIVENLVARGATPRIRLLELQRAIAAMQGDRDENLGLASAAKADIDRARAEIASLDEARQAEIAAELTAARTQIATLESRIRAAEDVLERHQLRAPQTGHVVTIALPTPGAVLGSGVALMTILPENDQLVALIRVPPAVIDNLFVGEPAELRLSAYRRVDVPVVAGEIAYVSADLLEDERTGQSYFEARVALDAEDVAQLHDARISAGMPIEVTIPIGSRRAGDYLLEPMLRFARHAFREE